MNMQILYFEMDPLLDLDILEEEKKVIRKTMIDTIVSGDYQNINITEKKAFILSLRRNQYDKDGKYLMYLPAYVEYILSTNLDDHTLLILHDLSVISDNYKSAVGFIRQWANNYHLLDIYITNISLTYSVRYYMDSLEDYYHVTPSFVPKAKRPSGIIDIGCGLRQNGRSYTDIQRLTGVTKGQIEHQNVLPDFDDTPSRSGGLPEQSIATKITEEYKKLFNMKLIEL